MIDLKEKLAALPEIFSRSMVETLMPGVISSKTLANLQWRGAGPPYHKLGRKVIYEKSAFLDWLINRIR